MVQLDERIAERRRQVRDDRRRSRLRRTVTVAALAVLVLVAAAVERSSLVALQEIRVEGTDRLSPGDVRAASGLVPGTSTLRLRLGAVEDRVRELPLVRDVQASRADPLTVVLDVEERVPVLVARGSGGEVLVDRDGVVLAPGRHDGLPVVQVTGRLPRPGARVAALPALANAHAVFVGLPGPLRTATAHYEATGPDELELVLHQGARVRWGKAERLDEKVRALGAVLQDLGDTPVTVIDVRAPGSPTVAR